MSNKQRRFRIPKNPISLVLFLWSHNRFLQKLSLHPDSFRSPFLLHRRNEHPQSHASNQQISDLSLTLCFHPHIASLVQTLPQILLKQLINHRSTRYPSVLPTSLAALCTRRTVGTWNTPQSRSLPAKPTRSTSNPASTRPCAPWWPRDSASCARRERTSRWGSSRGAGQRGRRESRRWATGRRWRGREDLNRSLFLSRVERGGGTIREARRQESNYGSGTRIQWPWNKWRVKERTFCSKSNRTFSIEFFLISKFTLCGNSN